MLVKIKQFFDTRLSSDNEENFSEHQFRLAAAALMIEVATIDQQFNQAELNTLSDILQREFELKIEEVEELIGLAERERHDATSLYQFTQGVNERCSPQQKFELIANMWRIAYADQHIDKYEEYVIRKVADLIYVSHSDFIRAKHQARG